MLRLLRMKDDEWRSLNILCSTSRACTRPKDRLKGSKGKVGATQLSMDVY